MKNTKFKLLLLMPFLLLFGCKKEQFKAVDSATVNMSGRWWVEFFGDANDDGIPTEDEYIYSYHDFGTIGLVTSNTAQNSNDSLLINDPEHSWPFKMIAPIDYSTQVIKPSTNLNIDSDYIGTGETVRVVEGKILKNAATLPSGRKGDSIFIKLEFSDDLGSFYMYSGHRDSGQTEDQH